MVWAVLKLIAETVLIVLMMVWAVLKRRTVLKLTAETALIVLKMVWAVLKRYSQLAETALLLRPQAVLMIG